MISYRKLISEYLEIVAELKNSLNSEVEQYKIKNEGLTEYINSKTKEIEEETQKIKQENDIINSEKESLKRKEKEIKSIEKSIDFKRKLLASEQKYAKR